MTTRIARLQIAGIIRSAGKAVVISAGLLLLPAQQAMAGAGFDSNVIPGYVLSIGRVDPQKANSETGLGNGPFLDLNYTHKLFNGGIAYKDLDAKTTANLYAGVGIGRIIQMQLGMGTRGVVRRARFDHNLQTLSAFLTGKKRSHYARTFEDRVTFTFSIERYSDETRFDNASIGFGLLY